MKNEQLSDHNRQNSTPETTGSATGWEVTDELYIDNELSPDMHDLILQAVEEEADGEDDSQIKREAVARELGKYAMLRHNVADSDQTEVGQFHVPSETETEFTADGDSSDRLAQ